MEILLVGFIWIAGLFTFYGPEEPPAVVASNQVLATFTNQIGPEGPKLIRLSLKGSRTCLHWEGETEKICLDTPAKKKGAPIFLKSWKPEDNPKIWRAQYADGLICDLDQRAISCRFPQDK